MSQKCLSTRWTKCCRGQFTMETFNVDYFLIPRSNATLVRIRRARNFIVRFTKEVKRYAGQTEIHQLMEPVVEVINGVIKRSAFEREWDRKARQVVGGLGVNYQIVREVVEVEFKFQNVSAIVRYHKTVVDIAWEKGRKSIFVT